MKLNITSTQVPISTFPLQSWSNCCVSAHCVRVIVLQAWMEPGTLIWCVPLWLAADGPPLWSEGSGCKKRRKRKRWTRAWASEWQLQLYSAPRPLIVWEWFLVLLMKLMSRQPKLINDSNRRSGSTNGADQMTQSCLHTELDQYK